MAYSMILFVIIYPTGGCLWIVSRVDGFLMNMMSLWRVILADLVQ